MAIEETPITTNEISDGAQKGGTRETHESYGMISVSRVKSSDSTALFGSDVAHHNLVEIRLQGGGERVRGLNHDWYHACGPTLLSVCLTEAQFVQMITSPNAGNVPCTIRRVGERSFSLPKRTASGIEHLKMEAQAYIDKAVSNLHTAQAEIEAISSGEKKANKATLSELHCELETAKQNLSSNQDYLVGCLQERLEKMHSESVAEFEAYVSSSLSQHGLESSPEERNAL